MSKVIFLKDYQPFPFSVEKIELDFALYDDHVDVKNHMKLKRQHPGPLHLSGDELVLLSLEMNGNILPKEHYCFEGSDLVIENCPNEFTLTITTQIFPAKNTKLAGLFRSNQLLCTQCEAEGFRRLTFYPDRPDVLSLFTTRISADKTKYPILLSNGNLINHGESDDGRHWVLWEDPFKKPSYLFALVAGELICVEDTFITSSLKKISLKIYVEPGNEDKCAHAMASLKKAMRWDEMVYGREYDLSVFMIVAVRDFNMGAMENKGLNIFNAKYILASPETATDQDFADIEGVVAHEYFHNWTGNRVTCRDWFQLSLKEGLTVFRDQEFSRDMNSRDVNRILDVKVLRATQFPEDAGRMAHPVRPESYQEINNFYTATVYNKGAEVIRMQQTLLGKEGFRRGMDLYFERHDGKAVTIDDFLQAMADANDVNLDQFARWYSQAGTPQVLVKSDYQQGTLTLTLTQTCPKTPDNQAKKPFHIPIKMALFSQKGEQIPTEKEVLELREAEETFVFKNLNEKPLLSLLRDFSAPIKLNYETPRTEALALLRFETDGYAKWQIAESLALQCITDFLNKDEARWQKPDDFFAALQHVLVDNSLDNALRAELITPPGFEEIATSLSPVEVDKVEKARDFYRNTLGKTLFTEAEKIYHTAWSKERNDMHGEAYSRRKLRNRCLSLMMKAYEDEILPVCQTQFSRASNMTDKIASFSLLIHCKNEAVQEQVINEFYAKWANNDLVLDKWFAIQASGEQPGTLQRVKSLLQHPAFSLKNPNKVRALIGTFSQANPRHFHQLDGSGYAFLTEILTIMDTINPQVAARLATPFTRWQRYDEGRQLLIKKELTNLVNLALSRDLKEIIEKSLL